MGNEDNLPEFRDTFNHRRRMAKLKRLLAKKKDITVAELALALEVSQRTIHRYIAQMKAAATHESKYTDADGMKFTEDFTYTDVEITESEMIAMMVAKEDLKSRNAAGLNRGITSTFKKIVSTASVKVLSRMKNWERVISFRLSGHSRIEPKIFDSMVRGAGNCERMKIDYRDPDGKETNDREIEVLHISNINGEWYAFARDLLREGKERCFAFCRIKKSERTGEFFEFPEGWTLDGFLGNSFGVYGPDRSGKQYNMVIRFRGRVADLIREKEWRCQTKLIELGQGIVELHLTVNGLFEVFLWVLEWGRNAKVVSPPELRTMVEEEIQAMAEVYKDSSW